MKTELKTVIYEKKGKIAYVTMNRPEARNAYNLQMMRDLCQVWLDFREDDALLVAILTGAGNKAFCAGGDLKDTFTEEARNVIRESKRKHREAKAAGREPTFEESPLRMYHWNEIEVWKPIIAAVNGWALAGGCSMALFCDIVIASENAKFGVPQATVGIMSATGSQRLARQIPHAVAMHMLLTGDPINAGEAYRVGMVSKVVPPAELLPTATKIAERICQSSPNSVKSTKEAAFRAYWWDFEETDRIVHTISRPVFRSEDSYEGLKAFAEKRQPAWKSK